MHTHYKRLKAFTLIELSIVLVIIGLIVGGVLVGRDLIGAAAVRSQISQIEKYQAAANTFRGKYNNYLPGDIPDPDASRFGLAARGPHAGQGDGNGIIQGNYNNSPNNSGGHFVAAGEGPMFWVDLGRARLIEDTFSTATPTGLTAADTTDLTVPATSNYFPKAQIGSSNFVFVWSGGLTQVSNGINYFQISRIARLSNMGNGPQTVDGVNGLTVAQAFAIDSKVDDGQPQSGNVLATNLSGAPSWVGPPYAAAWSSGVVAVPYTSAVFASSSTCFDNGGGSAPQVYSMGTNNGKGMNCALSFKFQ